MKARHPSEASTRDARTRAGGRSARVVTEVLRATTAELGRVGYLALRVEDVAQQAGVNKTTIYRRWPTKAELVTAALKSEAEDCETAPDTGSVRADILSMLRHFREHGRMPMVRVLMAELANPEVQAIAHGLKHKYEADWVRVIARAMARGELPAHTSPLLVTEVITSAVMGRIIRGELPDVAFCEALVDLVLAGAAGLSVELARRRPQPKSA